MRRGCAGVLAACLVLGASIVGAETCSTTPSDYNGYTVGRVDIDTALGFLSAATADFENIKRSLPLQPASSFSAQAFSAGVPLVNDVLENAAANGPERVKFVVVVGRLENCVAATHTLDVVYRTFTTSSIPQLSHTFEQRKTETEKPATTSAVSGAEGRWLIVPFGGFNGARREYGGLRVTATSPVPFVDRIDMDASGSSSSAVGRLAAGGSRTTSRTGLRQVDWRVGFQYLDTPAGDAHLKERKAFAQLAASTGELADSGLIIRYGVAYERGDQRIGGLTPALAAVYPDLADAGLKAYVGTTGRWSREALAASYGVQVGSTVSGHGIDFTKHIGDLAYSWRVLPKPDQNLRSDSIGVLHRPLDIEARVSGGVIQDSGRIPAAERFFGGNLVRPFIDGDSWTIPQGAFIRSIPENQLGGLDSQGRLGGTSFYSASLTIAKALWGKALIPRALGQDPQFLPALDAAIDTAKGELVDIYKARDPAYRAMQPELQTIGSSIVELGSRVAAVPETLARGPAVEAAVKGVTSESNVVARIVRTVQGGDNTQVAALVNMHLPLFGRKVEQLETVLNAGGATAQAAALAAVAADIDAARLAIKAGLQNVDLQTARTQADNDFKIAQHVLDTLLYEMNGYSIAPVAVVDVARVWPDSVATQYAVGGGVRLSLVNLNLTLGYAVNPKSRPGESGGALFFNLDIVDLFR